MDNAGGRLDLELARQYYLRRSYLRKKQRVSKRYPPICRSDKTIQQIVKVFVAKLENNFR